ncbi:MAG TPA: hypothetical protein VMJ70_16160 [Candidatus Sulfotelmatobacter sp.]|nr:hypothetical protein [Candidatus Sulfotelmatobacter sp.]
MKSYSLTHLSDGTLLQNLDVLFVREQRNTAEILAHIAEVDARKLHVPLAYPSLHEYCMGRFGLEKQAALKRVQAARAARKFPVLFEAIAEGRLSLSAVVVLAPHLTEETVGEWIAAAARQSKAAVELLIADRRPKSDVPEAVRALPTGHGPAQLAPGHVAGELPLSPGITAAIPDRARIAPLGAERFELQLTIPQSTHEKLRHAQDLLGSSVYAGELARVIDRALDALIAQLEKKKFRAGAKPRRAEAQPASPRHIPAEVRWTVHQRDGGRCTFVSDEGRRCECRKDLEYDHVQPAACGGPSTVGNLRLRCRAHNQYEAERTFGRDFMRTRREVAARSRAPFDGDLVRCLRNLGIHADMARDAAEQSRTPLEQPLEHRVRAALAWYGRVGRTRSAQSRAQRARACAERSGTSP